MEKKAILEPDKKWQETFPDGIQISEIFERQFRTSSSSQSTSKGAFATFQGEEEPSGQPNRQPNKQLNKQAKGQSQGQSQGKKPWKLRCLCDEIEPYLECPYLVEEIRPAGWIPDKEV